jgi:exosortase
MSLAPFLLAEAGIRPARAERALGPAPVAVAVLVLGTALLVGRTGYRLGTGLWQTEEHAYSPLILAAAIWLVWRKRALFATARSAPSTGALGLLSGALLLHLFFVLINNMTGTVTTLLVTVVAAAAAVWGWRPIRANGFAVATAAFCTPLPGSAIATVTFPLKMLVSRIAAKLLGLMGLPVERQGVMLELGNYRLLVADACSGIQSMFSLAAVSVVYIALMEYRSSTRVATLLLAILPISMLANVLRVLALALITYGFGDDAGQGFLHGFAGMFMFFVAFGVLMLTDSALNRLKVPQ